MDGGYGRGGWGNVPGRAQTVLFAISGRWTLARKIALSFVLVTFLMTFVVGMVSFYVSADVTAKMNYRMSESGIDNLSSSVDRALQGVEDSVNSLYRIPSFNRILGMETFDISKNIGPYNEAGSAISGLSFSNPVIRRISVWDANGFHYRYSHDVQKAPDPPYHDYETCRRYYFGDNHEMYRTLWHWRGAGDEEVRYRIGFTKILYGLENLDERGIITLELGETEMRKLCQGYEEAYLVTGDGTVISHADESSLGSDMDGTPVFLRIRDRGMPTGSFVHPQRKSSIVFYARLQTIDAYLVVPVDYGRMSKERDLLFLVTAALLASCGLLSIFLARAISRGITRPVMRLKRAMEQVQGGDLSVRFDADGDDELNYLGSQFNSMLDEIGLSIGRMRKAESAKGLAELKLLQSQINPHLLYNTLDSLLWYLDNRKVDEAVQVVSSLSGFFKISLSKGRLMLPLSEELEHVRHYIRIQKLCRDQEVALELEGDPALLALRVPKLTFQPIVENAILHAFGGYRHDGVIRIGLSTGQGGRLLRIVIEDNGLGMGETETASCNRRIHEPHDGENPGGFGLHNVDRRIRHLFGEGYGITVESELGAFTRVILLLPAVRGGETVDGES